MSGGWESDGRACESRTEMRRHEGDNAAKTHSLPLLRVRASSRVALPRVAIRRRARADATTATAVAATRTVACVTMFSARKKAKKEVPQWKLDQEREEAEAAEAASEAAGSSFLRKPDPEPEPPLVLRKPEPEPEPAPAPAPAPARPRSPDPNADAWGEGADDDDDDDDNFDESNYALDDAGGGEDDTGGNAAEDACCVSVTGIAHQTTGDHLREFFSSCGPVAQVLRAADVRDRSAFVIFASPAAATTALAKSGQLLHERAIVVEVADADAGTNTGGAAPWRGLGGARSDGQQLGQLGSVGVGKPQRGVVYTNDHSGNHRMKQGNDQAAWSGAPENRGMSTGAWSPLTLAPPSRP